MITSKAAPPGTLIDDALVQDVMHAGFVSCPFETPLVSVARLMARYRVHTIVGFGDLADDDTRLWGLVSDLDIVTALATGREAATAGEIGAGRIVTLSPRDSVRHALSLMHEQKVTHLLVMDGGDRPLGVLSSLDIATLVSGIDRTEIADGGFVGRT